MPAKFFGVLGRTDYINLSEGKKVPLSDLLDQYLQPDGWLLALTARSQLIPTDKPVIFESGAWGYREQEQPKIGGKLVTPDFVLQQYQRRSPKPDDLVVAPDHLLQTGNKLRVEFNYHSAKTFLVLAGQLLPQCIPAAVIHGESIKDKVQRAQELYEQGYRALAIGGLVPLANYKNLVFEAVKAVRNTLPSDCCLHVLGLSSPDYARYWHLLGIDSFDGSSYIQTALRGNEFLIASGRKLQTYKAVAVGQKLVAPTCYCPVCLRLAQEGFDPRTTNTRQANLGRVAHNLGQTLIAQFAAAIPRSIALVSGVSKKLQKKALVKELYCSSWWNLARNYVEASCLEWRVVSSKYGVLHPEQTLAPYEENPHTKTRQENIAWSQKVAEQLLQLAPNGSTFVFLGGNRYRDFVIPALHSPTLGKKYLTLTPLAGLGIGLQKQWLQQMSPKYVQLSIF